MLFLLEKNFPIFWLIIFINYNSTKTPLPFLERCFPNSPRPNYVGMPSLGDQALYLFTVIRPFRSAKGGKHIASNSYIYHLNLKF